MAELAGSIALAGALLAGLLLPWVGGAGLVARDSATLLVALPVELTDETPNGNTRVLAADGSLITEFYRHNRTPVTSDQIAGVMKQALVDIEDSRFYSHNGLDVRGTLRALTANVAAGGVREGGSTLTQQLVKQTLLQTADSPEEAAAATEQSIGRKLREARLALALEETYTKDEILTRYLNLVYFGQGAYGVQAAARTYFGVDAADLTLPQAAMLGGLVQSPAELDPIAHPDAARVRRDRVLDRMHELGHVTDQELADISAQPVAVMPSPQPPNGCVDAVIGGFFCDHLHTYLLTTVGLTQAQLEDGGYRIQTTLRPDVQAAGDQAVLNTLPMGADLAGMYTAVEPGTGHVLAMSTNRVFGCTDGQQCESVNLNTAASQGGGSTFKVFTAAAALEQGYGEQYTLTTGDRYSSRVYRDRGRPYSVGNSRDYPATLTLAEALYTSSNTYFLALEDALGSVEAPVRMAQRMGLRSIDGIADQIIAENRGSFTLGAEATSPLDLAGAYATLAANGTQCDPTPVTAITDHTGRPAVKDNGSPWVNGERCTSGAIPSGVATTMNQILRKDVEPGNPGQTAARAYVPGHQIAGKTGTSQENYSVSFVGYTPEYAASVMVLNPKANQDVGGFGGGKSATIWHDAMAPILAGQATADFPPADERVANGDTRSAPACATVTQCWSDLPATDAAPGAAAGGSPSPAPPSSLPPG